MLFKYTQNHPNIISVADTNTIVNWVTYNEVNIDDNHTLDNDDDNPTPDNNNKFEVNIDDNPKPYLDNENKLDVNIDDNDFEDNRTEVDPSITMGYIQFRNGTRGISIPGSAYEFEVNCSNGVVRSLNNGLGFQLRKRHGKFNEILDTDFPEYEHKSGTVGCIADIVEAIDTGRETKGNIRLARISTEITLGIVDSQRQQGTRIYMPMGNRSLYLGRW